ncbi:hypothetical protein O3M35_011372 [Rhynocoris fuscipes]|uniref:Uncharacterized protein n=1 Tax=Rhynocoris fuscipes TaxID=488301 RepID=A0AAW1CXB4_9HEMI
MENNPSPPPNKEREQLGEVDSLDGDDQVPSVAIKEVTAEIKEVVNQDEQKLLKHLLEDITEVEDLTLQELSKHLSDSMKSASSDKITIEEHDTILINDRPISTIPTITPLINKAYMINAEVLLGNNITGVMISEQPLTMRDFLGREDYLENKFLSTDKSFSSNQSENKSNTSDSTLSNQSDVKTIIAAQSVNKSIHSNHTVNKSIHSNHTENKSIHSNHTENKSIHSNHTENKSIHSNQIDSSSISNSKSLEISNKSDEMPQVNKDDLDENDLERNTGEEMKQITVSDVVEPSAPPIEETSNLTATAGGTVTAKPSNTGINTKQRKKSKKEEKEGKKSLNEIMRKIFKKKKQVTNTDN